MNVMRYLVPDLPYGTVPGAPHSYGKTFFWGGGSLPYFYQEEVAKNPNCHGSRAVAWLVGGTTFNRNDSPSPRQFFSRQNILKNKLAWGNAHWTNY